MAYIKIGKIVSTHGIKGELKIKSDTDFKQDRYKIGNKIFIKQDNKYEEVVISSYRVHKDLDLITINDLTNINDILDYVNKDVYILSESRKNLDSNKFYFDDLIGLEVYDEKNTLIGKVEDIIEVPQGSILRIIKNNGKKGMVPFVNEFIKEVDLQNKKIVIHIIEGLL